MYAPHRRLVTHAGLFCSVRLDNSSADFGGGRPKTVLTWHLPPHEKHDTGESGLPLGSPAERHRTRASCKVKVSSSYAWTSSRTRACSYRRLISGERNSHLNLKPIYLNMTSVKKAWTSANITSNLPTRPMKSPKCYVLHGFCSLFGHEPIFQNVLPFLAGLDMAETGRNDWGK